MTLIDIRVSRTLPSSESKMRDRGCLLAFLFGGMICHASFPQERAIKVKRELTTLPADVMDCEDRDVSIEGMERAQRARLIRKTRTDLGLSQTEFADRFHVPVGTLRDWEQARASAPDFAIAYVRVIGQHPDMVAKTVEVDSY